MMKMMFGIFRMLFILAIIASTYDPAQAQQAAGNYRIHLHADRKAYVTGEQIWFSILVADSVQGKRADPERIVYTTLLDLNGVQVSKVKMNLQDGLAAGYLSLPSSLVSGIYTLMAYLKNETISPCLFPVLVINPNRPPAPVKSTGEEHTSVIPSTTEVNNIVITTSKTQFGKREPIDIGIESGENTNTPLTVSIFRKDLLEAFADSLIPGYSMTAQGQIPSGHQQDLEGHHIKARVFPVNGTGPAPNIRVYVSVLGSEAMIATGISDANGWIDFLLPLIYAEAQLVFIPEQKGTAGYRIELDQELLNIPQAAGRGQLILQEYLADAIRERNIDAQAENAYRPDEKYRYLINNPDTTDFYGSSDKRYLLDDYTRFPNMEEILTEFVLEVRVKKNRDNVELQVLNSPYKKFFDAPPLVLLDGVPVTDIKQLLALDPLLLKSIDVVSRKFFLGPVSFSGIVHYKSYKGDLAGYTLPADAAVYSFEGIQLGKEYLSPAYSMASDNHIPDFRNLLYWSPATITDNTGKTAISCFSADLPGIYVISVNGIGAGGKRISGTREIEIK